MGRARGCSAQRLAARRTARRPQDRSQWSDEALERELRAFTADRECFPTLEQFGLEGRADLRSAVVDFGGVAFWAERVGLPLSPGRRGLR